MSTNEKMGDSDDDIEQARKAEDVQKNKADETKIITERCATLYIAAVKGDWGKAEEIYKNYPDDGRAVLGFSHFIRRSESESNFGSGDTALHVAAAAGHNEFGKQLVSKYLKDQDLEMKNDMGNTAFSLAAMTGNMELVLLMLEKNKNLTMIRNKAERLPVQMAALLGHEEMAKFLYCNTKNKLKQEDLIELLIILIDNDLYDFALSMVKEVPKLAIDRAKGKDDYFDYRYGIMVEYVDRRKNGETALHALARKPMMMFNEGILKRIYNRRTNKRMHREALKLVEHLWEIVVKQLDYYQIEDLVNKPFELISTAAEEGNIEFLSILISKHPALILKVNEDGYSTFHTAVSYRHANILSLIFNETRSMKDVIFALRVGNELNNIVHLAAKLPPAKDRLNVGAGAAFQMQREMLWFKIVSKLMPPTYAEAKNGNGKTARTLFSEEHSDLMKEGEEWMKRTAESCMLVSTLIATVVFAAAITVPGGVKEDTGTPNFLKKAAFMIFAISDTMSLVSSSCSILMFLSIFTARYAEEEFLWSLPTKLFWGVLSLFVSIIAMMVVFCATMFIIFYDGTIGPFVLAVTLGSIPVFMFSYQQNHILSQVYLFMPSYLSLIQDTRTRLID